MRELINTGSMDGTSAIRRQLRADQSLLQMTTLQHAMLAVVLFGVPPGQALLGCQDRDYLFADEDLATDCMEFSNNSEMSRLLNLHLERECQRL